ncbi:hypothetical protein AKO1_007261 [Acrasis kona]|uniref:Uncharacterized protein n=1 Tax=Acrasis kona TaxID=1008807 RepID=A0AAW2YTK9_9EUKA
MLHISNFRGLQRLGVISTHTYSTKTFYQPRFVEFDEVKTYPIRQVFKPKKEKEESRPLTNPKDIEDSLFYDARTQHYRELMERYRQIRASYSSFVNSNLNEKEDFEEQDVVYDSEGDEIEINMPKIVVNYREKVVWNTMKGPKRIRKKVARGMSPAKQTDLINDED